LKRKKRNWLNRLVLALTASLLLWLNDCVMLVILTLLNATGVLSALFGEVVRANEEKLKEIDRGFEMPEWGTKGT
jgi:hypothetical protein